ncbi:hypothetical protein LWE61_08070 [Sphingobium sufflavum]|uniref:hypothetical protein n=1 Tax=Sphingobium sufflavum TaxID=1129547 RepID=UPI001F32EFCB|nr:hypothetical protein [Sphingobium sufflavum]MCE7796517.1 hypothetical protein [Sphingobium sufflavum]
MTDPYLARGQQWVLALRKLMGYPLHAPTRHSTAFCASGERDLAGALHMAQIAAEMQKDMLNVSFKSIYAPEPSSVSLAVHGPLCIQWLPDCGLYAASETANVALLHKNKRWFFDDRNQLVSTSLPPRHRIARGEQVAWSRWRIKAAQMEVFELDGNSFVPAGRPLSEAVAVERLRVVN